VLGTDDPYVDIELIALTRSLCTQLGLSQVTLLINSLGDAQCRPAYREVLVSFLEGRADQLCDEHRDRWKDNPLRVLDCKRESCRSATADAPSQLDHLCDPCQAHWDAVVDGLGALGVAYEVAPRLVRGLDYYTRTTFELAADALDNAQNAIGGGGRYNGLVEALGGPPTPGIGFSMGIDRLLLACDAEGVFADVHAAVDVFVVDVVGGKEALLLTDELRRAGLRADRAFDQRSMKSQLKAADRSQAAVAVIVGEDERAAGTASLRVLRGAGPSGAGDAPRAQLVVPRGDVSRAVRDLIDETRAAGADPKENGL
jgi:histidyl-tRNA synthetase